MSVRPERLLLCSVMFAACAVAVGVEAVDHTAAMHLLPLWVLVVPLLLGRYPGERLIAKLAGARPPRCERPAPQSRPRTRPVRMPRRVVAWSLACRPPPSVATNA